MKKVLLSNLLLISVFSFAQVGINTPNPQGIFHVDSKNNNNQTGIPTAVQQADDFIITSNGSIAVGTTVPDASAILELNVNELASGSK